MLLMMTMTLTAIAIGLLSSPALSSETGQLRRSDGEEGFHLDIQKRQHSVNTDLWVLQKHLHGKALQRQLKKIKEVQDLLLALGKRSEREIEESIDANPSSEFQNW